MVAHLVALVLLTARIFRQVSGSLLLNGFPAILFNEAVAPRPALVVVGEQAVVVPTYDNPHAPSNGTCTLTGGGFSIDTIEPFDEPFTLDVLIVP